RASLASSSSSSTSPAKGRGRSAPGQPGGAELARPALEGGEELVQLVKIGAKRVHPPDRGSHLGQRARGVGGELAELSLAVLELAAQDELARPAFLEEIAKLGFGHGLAVNHRAQA